MVVRDVGNIWVIRQQEQIQSVCFSGPGDPIESMGFD